MANTLALSVLVVDDQSLIRDGISSLLQLDQNIKSIDTAENGQVGIQLALHKKIDVVLLDIRMPVLDGINTIKELKDKGYKGKIIMLTTFNDGELIVQSLKAGANGYLLKDIPAEELSRAIVQVYKGVFQLDSQVANIITQNLAKGRIPSELKIMFQSLTKREKTIFCMLGQGLTNGEIAEELGLSEGTVRNYVSDILSALGQRDRVQAALLAARLAGNSLYEL